MINKLFLALCLVTSAASAQDAIPAAGGNTGGNDRNLRIGVYVAPTICWMHPTAGSDDKQEFNVKSSGSKAGFIYGLLLDYYFAENYGIVTGIQVNSTGGHIVATNKATGGFTQDTVVSADFDYRLQFLEIPLALKLRTDPLGGSGVRFFGQAGVSLGFNISKKATYSVVYYDAATASNQTAGGDNAKLSGGLSIAPVMLQMNLGAGLEYPVTPKLSVYGGLFFNNGFLPDATKPNELDNISLGYKGSFRDANTRLNSFSLRLGMFF